MWSWINSNSQEVSFILIHQDLFKIGESVAELSEPVGIFPPPARFLQHFRTRVPALNKLHMVPSTEGVSLSPSRLYYRPDFARWLHLLAVTGSGLEFESAKKHLRGGPETILHTHPALVRGVGERARLRLRSERTVSKYLRRGRVVAKAARVWLFFGRELPPQWREVGPETVGDSQEGQCGCGGWVLHMWPCDSAWEASESRNQPKNRWLALICH